MKDRTERKILESLRSREEGAKFRTGVKKITKIVKSSIYRIVKDAATKHKAESHETGATDTAVRESVFHLFYKAYFTNTPSFLSRLSPDDFSLFSTSDPKAKKVISNYYKKELAKVWKQADKIVVEFGGDDFRNWMEENAKSLMI